MQAQAKPTRDTVTASATAFRATRVSIVLSSYEGGGDHFGNAKFTGVPEPRPAKSELTDAQLRALTLRAIELANHPDKGFRRVLGRDESVLVLASRNAEPAMVAALLDALKANGSTGKVTVLAEADIAKAPSVTMPAPGVWSRRDVTYRVPRAILDADRVIPVAPLRIENGRPSLTIDSYRMLSGAPVGDAAALDLFGFHPADFAILGGSYVLRNGSKIRHNVVLAGAVATAVDAVGAAVLNVKAVKYLETAHERGFGDAGLDYIWTIGNEIDDAKIAG